jgi:hypothetical protein
VVEHTTENRGVPSSSLGPAIPQTPHRQRILETTRSAGPRAPVRPPSASRIAAWRARAGGRLSRGRSSRTRSKPEAIAEPPADQADEETGGTGTQERVMRYLERVPPAEVLKPAERYRDYPEARALALARIERAGSRRRRPATAPRSTP